MEIFDPGSDESASPSEPPSLARQNAASDVQRSGGGRPSLWRAPSESEPRFQRLIPSERRDDVADVRDWRLLTLKKVLQKRGESAARGGLLIALRLGKVSIAERPESCGSVRYDASTHIFDR